MFIENLPAYFADFGEDVSVADIPGRAIFDNGYTSVLDGMIATLAPSLTINQADFPSNLGGAPAVVRGTAYTVANVEADGTGVAVLRLERV